MGDISHEFGMGQHLGQMRRQAQEIAPVGAVAMQQHHQLARAAAGGGRVGMGGELDQAGHDVVGLRGWGSMETGS
jgi:hypothetical protein